MNIEYLLNSPGTKEIADAIKALPDATKAAADRADAAADAALAAANAGARTDIQQHLNDAQKTTARSNIDALGFDDFKDIIQFSNHKIVLSFSDGYVDYTTGTYHSYSENGKYAVTDFIPVRGIKKLYHNCNFRSDAGIAFYDADETFISGINTRTDIAEDEITLSNDDIAYMRISDYNANAVHTDKYAVVITGGFGINIEDIDKKTDKITTDVIGVSIEKYAANAAGYIDYRDGVLRTYGADAFYYSDYIDVSSYKHIRFTDVAFDVDLGGYAGYAFYTASGTYISGGYSYDEIDVPLTAKYLRFSDLHEITRESGYALLYGDGIDQRLEAVEKLTETETGTTYGLASTAGTAGYINYINGTASSYDTPPNSYKRSDYCRIYPLKYSCYYDGVLNAEAGVAFYNINKRFISGTNALTNPLDVPPNAAYVRFSDYDSKASGDFRGKFHQEKLSSFDKIKKQIRTVICCTGDSTTQGMWLNGAFNANYGESPYPARLKTILVDNGYDIDVINQGHGGERTTEIAVRIGAFPCYFAEDVTVPANWGQASLGTAEVSSGRVAGTKIKIPYADSQGEDYCVFFTQTSHDTNPLTIDGDEYILSVVAGNENKIRKKNTSKPAVTIKAGTYLYTNDQKNATINIVCGGINDGASLTLQRWIDTMKKCIDVNGGKAIILGSTHALWNSWSDVTGTTDAEKYIKYKNACMKELGNHWINLYDLFFEHALAYALESGYFTDATQGELDAMQALLEQHIIPAQFSYDGESQGNVHLSEAGYHVIAMLIFERLKCLSYI